MKNFKGIVPPISTIFNENGDLDKEGMGLLIDHLISTKVNGLFFLGTGGEFSQMSVKKRLEVAEFATKYVDSRVPVLIGTGGTSTEEVIYLSKHAQSVGADGVVIINPYYWNLAEEHLFKHYSDIANEVEMPIMLYNFPPLTGQDISAEFVLSLVDKHSNIVGIKETLDSIGHINDMIAKVKSVHPEFSVFCGFDNHLANTLTMGGDGIISAAGNFASSLQVEIYEAFQNEDYNKAIPLQKRLSMVAEMYKLDTPFINVAKEATKLTGIDISTYVLPPSRALSSKKIKEVESILKRAELI